jgi:hypothetical protein
MDLEAKKAFVRRVRAGIKVGEVFCTKIVKGPKGESVLVGLTADLGNLSITEAEVATLVLGARVDQVAFDRAAAGSVISSGEHAVRSRKTKANYSMLLDEALQRVERAKEVAALKLQTGTDG